MSLSTVPKVLPPAALPPEYTPPTWVNMPADADTRDPAMGRILELRYLMEKVLRLTPTVSHDVFSALRLFVSQNMVYTADDLLSYDRAILETVKVRRPVKALRGGTFDPLSYQPNATVPIPVHEINLLMAVRNYMEIHKQRGTPRRAIETINPVSFDTFRTTLADFNPYMTPRENSDHFWLTYGGKQIGGGTPPPGGGTPAGAGSTMVRTVQTLADVFDKGHKRDSSSYPQLKDEFEWDAWSRTVYAKARLDKCTDVLDPLFDKTSKTAEEQELFQRKNEFMYTALSQALKTSHGKYLVRLHATNLDAQLVWTDLIEHMTESTKAKICLGTVREYLTTMRYTKTFPGTTLEFVEKWLDELRIYNELSPLHERIRSEFAMVMLKMAVSTCPPLHKVEADDMLQVAKGEPALTWMQYKDHLMNTAMSHDLATSKGHDTVAKRAINAHELSADCDESVHGDDPDPQFDIDMPIDMLMVNTTQQRRRPFLPRRPSLNRDTWKSLKPDDQKVWDQLSQDAKQVIINFVKNKTTPPDERGE